MAKYSTGHQHSSHSQMHLQWIVVLPFFGLFPRIGLSDLISIDNLTKEPPDAPPSWDIDIRPGTQSPVMSINLYLQAEVLVKAMWSCSLLPFDADSQSIHIGGSARSGYQLVFFNRRMESPRSKNANTIWALWSQTEFFFSHFLDHRQYCWNTSNDGIPTARGERWVLPAHSSGSELQSVDTGSLDPSSDDPQPDSVSKYQESPLASTTPLPVGDTYNATEIANTLTLDDNPNDFVRWNCRSKPSGRTIHMLSAAHAAIQIAYHAAPHANTDRVRSARAYGWNTGDDSVLLEMQSIKKDSDGQWPLPQLIIKTMPAQVILPQIHELLAVEQVCDIWHDEIQIAWLAMSAYKLSSISNETFHEN